MHTIEIMKVTFLTGLLVIGLLLSGCSGSTGWRVSFGVAPVKSLDDKQGLVQTVKNDERRY